MYTQALNTSDGETTLAEGAKPHTGSIATV